MQILATISARPVDVTIHHFVVMDDSGCNSSHGEVCAIWIVNDKAKAYCRLRGDSPDRRQVPRRIPGSEGSRENQNSE